MSQNAYTIDQPEAFAGMKGDSEFDNIESFAAEGVVDFGFGLVKGESDDQVKTPILNKSVLSIDADLVTSNSTIATVNGNSTTATVFASTHAATMAVIAGKIAALAGIASAVYSGSGRDITIVGDNGVVVTSSAVTTAGAGQGTWTQAQSSNDVFRGISVHQHTPKAIGTGIANYKDTDTVSTMRQGRIWMRIETANIGTLAVDDIVFTNVAIGGVQEGRVTSVSTNNVVMPRCVCRKLSVDPDGLAIALIGINLP